MVEESPHETTLHIYPSNEFTKSMETYTLNNYKSDQKRRFKFKCNIKYICRKRTNVCKFPRTAREHTDFDKYSHETTCPNCLCYIRTKIYHYNTYVTHIMAVILLPIWSKFHSHSMCMIPYCTNVYKNTAHYCPRCKIYLGTKFAEGSNIFHHCIASTVYY